MAADRVFTGDASIRVLVAGPGYGKSTLLRRHLLTAEGDPAAPPTAVPVLVRAGDLIGAPLLAPALAHSVTGQCGPFGLSEEVTEDFFRCPPRPGTQWLVMIDGLDEVPERTARLSLLDRLEREARQADSPYWFLIATRPLPGDELERLPRSADRFTLEPFTDDDVRSYVRRRLDSLPDADRHVRALLDRARRARLEELARIPLMTAMLCQLYEADPDRPLPDGRAGVFRSFVELLYEENVHKGVSDLHDQAVGTLVNRYQIPSDRRAVAKAAEHTREHLPTLIDFLAHERIGGNRAPATEILAAQPHARRPEKVKAPLWEALLASLLHSCGLLTGHGDDVEFLHPTLQEYHAARHATRDARARQLLFDRLFPARRLGDRLRRASRRRSDIEPLDPLGVQASYLGFLLDALLLSERPLATATLRAMDDLFGSAKVTGYHLLKAQLQLDTGIPRPKAAAWLTAYVNSPAAEDRSRVEAAWDLAELEGHLDDGAHLLTRLTRDRTLAMEYRMWAAEILAGLAGHERAGGRLLLGLIEEEAPYNDPDLLIVSARVLARLPDHGPIGVQLLTECAEDPACEDELRSEAARSLTEVDGHFDHGVNLLQRLALVGSVAAARNLCKLDDPHREYGIHLLTAFAEDRATAPDDRAEAALALARMPGHRDHAVLLFTELFPVLTAGSQSQMAAAERLAQVDAEAAAQLVLPLASDCRIPPDKQLRALHLLARSTACPDEAAHALADIASDQAQDASTRIHACEALTELDEHREQAVLLLLGIARDGGVDMWDRVAAASRLAWRGEDRAAGLLLAFTTDPTATYDLRVAAAGALVHLDAHRAEGLRILSTWADDPRAHKDIRRRAATSLTTSDYYRIRR